MVVQQRPLRNLGSVLVQTWVQPILDKQNRFFFMNHLVCMYPYMDTLILAYYLLSTNFSQRNRKRIFDRSLFIIFNLCATFFAIFYKCFVYSFLGEESRLQYVTNLDVFQHVVKQNYGLKVVSFTFHVKYPKMVNILCILSYSCSYYNTNAWFILERIFLRYRKWCLQ